MKIKEHLDKNNLHHAYLIEGAKEEVVPELFVFFEDLNVKTSGNPDFAHITLDNFKIDEAFSLRAMSTNKGFSSFKKIFVICANSFTLDAQNVLLKMFEEPIENTHFFLVVPDTNVLLRTLVSRFYLIKNQKDHVAEVEAEKFIKMSMRLRFEFIKELLSESDAVDEDDGEMTVLDSNRSKALNFLNALETLLHQKVRLKTILDLKLFEHIFKVREFLRMPGSSVKTLMESVALVIPTL